MSDLRYPVGTWITDGVHDGEEMLRRRMEDDKNADLRGPGNSGNVWEKANEALESDYLEIQKRSKRVSHSPSDIDVLLHYNSRPVVHPRIDAPAVKEAMSRFIDNGIFRTISELPYCELTIKGRMWVEMICATPYPETWLVDPDGRVVPRQVEK